MSQRHFTDPMTPAGDQAAIGEAVGHALCAARCPKHNREMVVAEFFGRDGAYTKRICESCADEHEAALKVAERIADEPRQEVLEEKGS